LVYDACMSDASTPIKDLPNLGAKCEKWFAQIGIHTRGDIEKIGIVQLYAMVKEVKPKTSIVLLWALFGALNNMHFSDVPEEIKGKLKEQLAAL
jgi:DNA transformation protein